MSRDENQSGLATVMTGYLLGVASSLEASGVNARDLLDDAGVRNELSNDPFNRFPTDSVGKVFRLASEASGDPYFSLNVAQAMRAPDFHVVGLGLLASGSMLSFAHRLVKYLPLISGAGGIELEQTPSSFRIVTRPFGRMCTGGQDSWLAFLYRLMREIHSSDLRPLRVELMHQPLRGDAEPYREHFGAPVFFGSNECVLEFSRADMLQPLRSGCEELAGIQDVSALSYLARVQSADVVARVQLAILDCLRDEQSVTLEAVSNRMRLSSRQIHQGLVDSKTNYQTVLDQTRIYLAKEKLKDSRIQITEIAYLVGFTDSANFSRAFKRWTGHTPRSYRNRPRPISA
jgi:AraC-like DNA-binding protein